MKSSEIVDNVKDQAADLMEQVHDQTEHMRKSMDAAYENAAREMKKMRMAAEDMVEDGRHRVRKAPMASVGLGIAVGVVIGFAIGLATGVKSRR